jgi:hypothetical protein
MPTFAELIIQSELTVAGVVKELPGGGPLDLGMILNGKVVALWHGWHCHEAVFS